jgi:hypothetical protein
MLEGLAQPSPVRRRRALALTALRAGTHRRARAGDGGGDRHEAQIADLRDHGAPEL